jgi:RND family efflux transporter MFP subunit
MPFRSALTITLTAALLVPAASALAIELDCVAEPAQRVDVGSPTTGLLAEIRVGRGDAVTAGQVVARLDSTVEEANVALAEAQATAREALTAQQTRLTLAEAALARGRQLQASGSVTDSRIEELEAGVAIISSDVGTEELRLRIADIELKRQQALLARQSIVSPLTGFVTEQALRVGEFVRQDSALMTLVQTDPLYIEAYVPAAQWGEIVPGTVGRVGLDQPPGTALEATVTVVDPVFDAASGTFGIRLELPNPGSAIPAGQRCRLTFEPPAAASPG